MTRSKSTKGQTTINKPYI